MRILYLQNRFGTGGINRITSVKENYLVSKGIEIHNLNVLDEACVPQEGMYSDKIIFHSINSSLKFEIKAKQFYAASQRVL